MTRLVVPENVGVYVADGIVYVAPLPDGPIAVLGGIAAFIWTEALEVSREQVAATIAAVTSERVEDLEPEVAKFIDDLLARGLLSIATAEDEPG